MSKTGAKNLEWISANGEKVEGLAGHWITLRKGGGVLSSDSTLPGALRKARLSGRGAVPYVFRVPSAGELEPFDLSAQWAKTLRGKKG